MKKILLEDAFILNAIKLARFWARVLPVRVSFWIARRIGSLVFYLTKRRNVAYKNLRMVFAHEKSPDKLRAIAKKSFQNLAISAIEMLRIPEMTPGDVEKNIRIQGRENYEPLMKRGKGLIFLAGHFGNWELLSVISGLLGYSIVALARVQKHPRSDAYLNTLRRSKGAQIIHKGMPIREILKALKRGHMVGILSDQDGGKQGCFVNFFNRLSSTPPGAAAFSIKTGSPVLPLFMIRGKDGFSHQIVAEKPIPLPDPGLSQEEAQRSIIQSFTTSLEKHIREFPEQWLWAHRRWKSSPDRHVLILSDKKAGHFNQSKAVFDAIKTERKNHTGFEDRVFLKIIEPVFKSRQHLAFLRGVNLLFRGHLPGMRLWMRWCLESESYSELLSSYADVIVSCGASLTDINLWLKKENLSKSVIVMKPSLPLAHFDAVVAPKHDNLDPNQANVFATDGALSSISARDLEIEGAALAAELNLPAQVKRVGILIGGDTKYVQFDVEKFNLMLKKIKEAALVDLRFLATTSRRTPVWAAESLKKELKGNASCPVCVIANESNKKGIVAGIIALSDILVVTSDSISMVSESVCAGKFVIVADVHRGKGLKERHMKYLTKVESMNLAKFCGAYEVGEYVRNFDFHNWTPEINYRANETEILSKAARRVM